MAKETKKKVPGKLLSRVASLFRPMFGPDMSDTDVRDELREELNAKEPGLAGIIDVFDKASPPYVVYMVYEAGEMAMYMRTYTSTDDEATVDDARVEVEVVTTYEPVEDEDEPEIVAAASVIMALGDVSTRLKTLAGKEISAGNMKKIAAVHDAAHSIHDTTTGMGVDCAGMKTATSTCGCKTRTAQQEGLMKENVKKLIAASAGKLTEADAPKLEVLPDDAIAAMELGFKPAAAPPPAPVVEPKVLTSAEVVALLPQDMRDDLDRVRSLSSARKEKLIKLLDGKQDVFTTDQLKAMALPELERTAKLAKIEIEPMEVSFAPRAAGDGAEAEVSDVFTNPPDPYKIARENANKPATAAAVAAVAK